MSLYDAREHVRTIGRCPSRHDPEPTDTPVSPPPHLELSRHSVQPVPIVGTGCTEWLKWRNLGGGLVGDGGGSSFDRRHIAQILSTRHRHVVIERVSLRCASRNVQFGDISL